MELPQSVMLRVHNVMQQGLLSLDHVPALFRQAKVGRPSPEVIIYISGYLAIKIMKKNNCSSCTSFLKKDSTTSTFIKLKTLKNCILTEPTKVLIDFVAHCESIFSNFWIEAFHSSSLVSKLKGCVKFQDFPGLSCHPEIKNQIAQKFFILRTRQQCKLMSEWLKNNKRPYKTSF